METFIPETNQTKPLSFCVIVPTYNNHKTLIRVLDSVLEYTTNVIVVNDGSGEGVVDVPLDPSDTPVQLHLERVVVVGVALGKVDDIADSSVAGHGADQVSGVEARVGRVGSGVDELRIRAAAEDGGGAAHTIRITHAWLRTGNDWRIIGGMSMPEPETPGKEH